VSGLLFKQELEHLIPDAMNCGNTAVMRQESENSIGPNGIAEATDQRSTESSHGDFGAQSTNRPSLLEEAEARFSELDTQTHTSDLYKERVLILDTGIELGNSDNSREDYLRNLKCTYCERVSKTQSEARFVVPLGIEQRTANTIKQQT